MQGGGRTGQATTMEEWENHEGAQHIKDEEHSGLGFWIKSPYTGSGQV